MPGYDQPLSEADLISQLQDVEMEFTLQELNAVRREKIQRTPEATNTSSKRVVRDKHIGTGGITVEGAGLFGIKNQAYRG